MSRSFHIGDVLTVTTGVMVSARGMEGVYDILNHMTGESLFTHQLPRAARACGPELLRQHPRLSAVVAEPAAGETWEAWLNRMATEYGSEFAVAPLAAFTRMDPVEELAAMVGPERVKVVVVPGTR